MSAAQLADGVLSVADVAERAGVGPSTIRAYVSRGQMPQPSGRFGREPFWSAGVLDDWFAARSAVPVAE